MGGPAEELEGVGKVLRDGNEIGEVFYSIRVYRAGVKQEAYPFARFRRRGYLDFYDLIDKPLTLILEDGRRWGCCIKTLDGSVVATGTWPSPA